MRLEEHSQASITRPAGEQGPEGRSACHRCMWPQGQVPPQSLPWASTKLPYQFLFLDSARLVTLPSSHDGGTALNCMGALTSPSKVKYQWVFPAPSQCHYAQALRQAECQPGPELGNESQRSQLRHRCRQGLGHLLHHICAEMSPLVQQMKTQHL